MKTTAPDKPGSQSADYDGMLAEMIDLTDRMSLATTRLDEDEIDRLLAEREVLCTRIVSCREGLSSIDTNTERMEQTLLAKQAACESAVSQLLQQARTNLAELHAKKGLRYAYGAAGSANTLSHFLDNKT